MKVELKGEVMEHKEAIKCIDNVLSSEYHYDETLGYQLTSDDFEWLEMAKTALKKQMPKKPLKEIKESENYCSMKCPSCNYMFWDTDDWTRYEPKICPDCGQVIDWFINDSPITDDIVAEENCNGYD